MIASPLTVSIVIPAYDAASDLEHHLPVLRREMGDAELIVVDDGSSDATSATAARHGATVLRQEQSGPAAARNLGARHARGDVIVFLDADCCVTPGWLAALLRPLEDPSIAAVKGAYLTLQPSAVARLCQIEFEERYEILSRRPRVDFVDSFSMAVRRQTFLDAGGFDETFRRADNEDVDLSFRLDALGHGIAFAPAARVVHRHPDTFRRYARLKLSRGYYRMRVYERYPAKAARDSYTPLSLKLQGASALLALLAATLAPAALVASPPLAGALLGAAAIAAIAIPVTGIPFLARTARRDPPLLAPAALFLLVRAAAIGTGVLARTLRLPPPRPK